VVYVQLDGKGDALGNALVSAIEYTMGTKQRGRIEKRKGVRGEYYGVLRGAASVGTVGLILEHSFHTNTKSAKWLMNQDNLDEMAQVEADIIAKYLGVSKSVGVNLPVLKRGAQDGSVWSLQALLLGFGYDLGTTGAKKDGVDGSFGAKTEEALKKYQFENDLTVDGSCGKNTWSNLLGID
jgi:peptidoglycan hydrolase-like protein with peptidoglycan-binding domain